MLRRRRSRRREQERSADNNNSSISSNSGDNHEGIAASHPRLDEDESLVDSEAVEYDTTTLISDSSIPLRDSSTDNSVAAAAAAAAAVSANNGRREKHRFFRAQRARSVATTTTTTPTSSSSRTPRSASSSSTPPRFELELDVGHGPPRRLHSQQDTISVDEEASGDTIGSLPNEPSSTFLMNDRISTLTENSNQQHPSTTSTSSPNVIAPDYIPPPVVPGAVYTRGRAFGEIPRWMRQQCNNSNTTASSRSSELLGLVQRRRRRPRETTRDGPPPPTIPQETGRRHPQISTRTPPGSPVGTSTGLPRGQLSSSLEGQRPGVGPRSTSLLSGRAGNLTSNSSHLPRGRLGRSPRSFLRRSVSSPSQRTNFSHSLTGSVRNLFTSLRSSSYSALLPEAEALDSEKVVYAEVIVDEEGHDQQHDSDEDDSVVCSWELLLYSVILLSMGFWIGRITAAAPLVPSSSSTAAL